MRTLIIAALAAASAVSLAGQSATPAIDLPGLLARVGQRVEAYYQRAQSILCTETISFETMGGNFERDPRVRRLVYELRMSFEKTEDGQAPEGSALRTLKTVNGKAPRAEDELECLNPKPVSLDPLSFLLPQHQAEYTFTYKGIGRTGDGHTGVMIDYVPVSKDAPKYTWKKTCFSVEAPARTTGRVWVDRFGGDILRVDESVRGPIDIDVPKTEWRKTGIEKVQLERSDVSIRYRTVTFANPPEIVLLPDQIEYMTVIRSPNLSRQRTTHSFADFQRFVTGGRVVTP